MLLLTLLVIFVLPLLTSPRYHRFQYKPRNIQCHCVPPHLCNDEDAPMNGHGLLDPRMGSSCSKPSEICCKNPKLSATPNNVIDQPLEKPPRCGYSANSIKSRILSGTATSFGELPWNLIIQEISSDKNIYKCGASLIHPRVALTAAHCIQEFSKNPENILVRAGEWNVDSNEESSPFQDNNVEEILIHYNYNPSSLQNDISILILEENFKLEDNVGVVCLATPSEKFMQNLCIASGWGKDAHQKGKYSSTLKKVQVPLVPRDYCLEKLKSTRLGSRFLLHKSFICAGGKKNEDSCKGDGGSPLICPLLSDRNRFVQIGIVSWGIGCGNEGIPGVYVNVLPYLEWIEGEMAERNLDSSYFKI